MSDPPDIPVVLLVDRAGRILLHLRDSAAPRFPDLWSLPGGHAEPGEPLDEAAARELWEEAALVSDIPLEQFEAYRYEDDGRVLHYFVGSTCALDEDVVLGEGAALAFATPAEVFDGRPFVPGVEDVIGRFMDSPTYTRLADGTPLPYLGDGEPEGPGPRYDYVGDRYVCPLADEHRTCHRRTNLLLAQGLARLPGRAERLEALAAEGHRCAFVRLMELLVATGRVDDLRRLARAGDQRAGHILDQYVEAHPEARGEEA